MDAAYIDLEQLDEETVTLAEMLAEVVLEQPNVFRLIENDEKQRFARAAMEAQRMIEEQRRERLGVRE